MLTEYTKSASYVNEVAWGDMLTKIEAMLSLIDPNKKQIRIATMVTGLIVLEHKKTNSSIRITNLKTAMQDITYFINNDPAKQTEGKTTPNENVDKG